jgi:hypothetical protein
MIFALMITVCLNGNCSDHRTTYDSMVACLKKASNDAEVIASFSHKWVVKEVACREEGGP